MKSGAPANDALPNSRGHKGFYVYVSGKIESGQIHRVSSPVCHYEFVCGEDWNHVSGFHDGESQAARNESNISENEPSVVWNFPIDVTYKSTNAFGWPRIVVTVRDAARVIKGYGAVHVPTVSGQYERYVRLFTPRSASWAQQISSMFAQEPPEFFDPRFTTASDGREAARVISSGVVKVSLMVRTVGMQELGFDAPAKSGMLC